MKKSPKPMIMGADPARNPFFGLAAGGENDPWGAGPDMGLHPTRTVLTSGMLRAIERMARVDIYCHGEGGFYRPVGGW
jgi:hypothetical protein